jgi:hypothetical protein
VERLREALGNAGIRYEFSQLVVSKGKDWDVGDCWDVVRVAAGEGNSHLTIMGLWLKRVIWRRRKSIFVLMKMGGFSGMMRKIYRLVVELMLG